MRLEKSNNINNKGSAQIRIEQDSITLNQGEIVVVEPGEAHTFISNSTDYFHIVIHTPGLKEKEAQNDKVLVSRERLSL